jgi:dienelactone hydrolase
MLVVLLVIVAATLLGPVVRDPSAGFVALKGRLARVELQAATRQGLSIVTELRLLSDTGLTVDLAVRVPAGPVKPRAAILVLGGKGTGRDAARLGGDTGDVVVAALSYPFAGDPEVKGLRAVLQVRQIQRAVLDTVPAILLATDYLLEQPYIDANRLELVGVSLGAFLVSPAGALDERIRRVWIVHGAGDPEAVIDYGLRDDVRNRHARRMTAALITVLAAGHYLAPEHWVGRISPRPVIAINARDDERLPRASVNALHKALRAPCEIIWVDGPHVQPNRPEAIELLGAQILQRVSGEAFPSRSSPQNSP